MQKSSENITVEYALLNDAAWILAGDMTDEASELTEVGTALGIPSFMILEAIRNYGTQAVRQAMVVTARDVTKLAGIH